jgi:hypothetical protein
VRLREREKESVREDGMIMFRNVVGLKTAEIEWAEKHLPVTSGFLQCTKLEENV